MNNNIVWFPFYIGDYIKDTQELSPIEHGMYLKLMLWYYTKGKPIPHNKRYSICGANDVSNDNHLLINCNGGGASSYQLCDELLVEFFHRDGDVWRHKRIDGELKKQNDISEKRRAAVAQREKNKSKNSGKKPLSSDISSDNHLMTQSQSQSQDIGEVSPITPQAKSERKKYVTKPDDVSEQVWSDFVAHRKKKKADITHTAIDRIRSQAALAGWSMEEALAESVARGWTGFKAEWVNKEGEKNGTKTGRFNKPTVTEAAGNVFDAIQRGDI